MIGRIKRLLPDVLAGRIVLLLTVAIIVANLIALAVLTLEQDRFDKQASEEREIERIAALIPTLEAVDPQLRGPIAANASTRFARVRVDPAPILRRTATDRRSMAIASRLEDALGRDDLAVAIIDRPPPPDHDDERREFRTNRVIAISVRLATVSGRDQFLNVTTSGAAPRNRGIEEEAFVIVLIVSLLFVLLVAVVFARRLTRPLAKLAEAARAAGRGDRTARVPEDGAREMREAAQAFNAMQAEISQFEAERMRMLAAVGHDLRTPMTSLRIRAEMVDDEALRNAMVRTLDEMTVMADGLVSFAKDSRDAEEMEPIRLGQFLTKICANHDVPCHINAEIRVMARPVGLGRAIGNLIENAQRYGDTPEVTLVIKKTHVQIMVEDRGQGIAPDQLEDMFQPFRRGESSRNEQTGGTGLGLSIARTIIIAHGGQITLENRTKGGLRAIVTLPVLSED